MGSAVGGCEVAKLRTALGPLPAQKNAEKYSLTGSSLTGDEKKDKTE
jgi:hypothetical protein